MAQQVIAEEVFEAMLDGAIDDLKLSGLSEDEMFSIVENNFGLKYAEKFVGE
jgi:hypothetical protein